jgi:long-chain acyl-CoA synthetase
MSICDLLGDRARDHPERTALVFGSNRLSYRQLASDISECAASLRQQGVNRGNRVALLQGNTPDFVRNIFALFKLGAVAVLLDLNLKPAELRRRLALAKATALIADKELETGLRSAPGSWDDPVPRGLRLEQSPSAMLRAPMESTSMITGGADDTAVVQFSSGTTGQSKCLSRTQRQLIAEFGGFSQAAGVGDGERVLCPVSLSHAHGLCNGMMAALLSGGTLILVKSLVPHELLKLLTEERITIMTCVPFLLETLLKSRAGVTPREVQDLRLCISAGAALKQETYEGILKLLGVRVRQLYGTTETGAIALNSNPQHAACWNSVGRPLPSMEVRILDTQGRQCPVGVAGEVAVRSPQTFAGYENETGESPVFQNGFFRTGDLGSMDGCGNLSLTGRLKLLINVAGKKVNPAEVEQVLRQHPKVEDVVVVGVRGVSGQEWVEECVKACVVPKAHCSIWEIHEFCGRHLARYQVPKIVEFLDEIPKSATGKILRSALVEATC